MKRNKKKNNQEKWVKLESKYNDLQRDFDYLIKRLYQWKIQGENHYESDDDSDDKKFLKQIIKDIRITSKKHGIYPYNQDVVRMDKEWFGCCLCGEDYSMEDPLGISDGEKRDDDGWYKRYNYMKDKVEYSFGWNHGHHSDPLYVDNPDGSCVGRCCRECNGEYVIPSRFGMKVNLSLPKGKLRYEKMLREKGVID